MEEKIIQDIRRQDERKAAEICEQSDKREAVE